MSEEIEQYDLEIEGYSRQEQAAIRYLASPKEDRETLKAVCEGLGITRQAFYKHLAKPAVVDLANRVRMAHISTVDLDDAWESTLKWVAREPESGHRVLIKLAELGIHPFQTPEGAQSAAKPALTGQKGAYEELILRRGVNA